MLLLPLDAFPQKLHRHVDPKAPPPIRMMAARGMAPIAPHEMAMVLYQLSLDDDEALADTAKKTWIELPEQLVLTAAQGDIPGVVLGFILTSFPKSSTIAETVLANASVPDDAVAKFARTASEALTEIIAGNEVRLLRAPHIIEALYLNENARMSTVERVVELARRNGAKFENVVALQMQVGDKRAYSEHEEEEPDIETSEIDDGKASNDDAFASALAESLEEEARREPDDGLSERQRQDRRNEEVEKQAEKKGGSRMSLIDGMSISEKMRLASLGSRADRDYLIRSPNRLVHMAAVTSPKVMLRDVVAWSGNKGVADGVITYIANRREYRRNYTVILNLAQNPKTPLKEAVGLLNSLQPNDLGKVMRNRNVPMQVQRAAKRLKQQREKRRN